MSNRHTLAANKLDDFSEWLLEDGWSLEPTKGDFEVLRARKDRRILQLYTRMGNPQHITVMDKDHDIVRQYLNTRENIHLREDEILSFIRLFSNGNDETSYKFTKGLCYWFAFILTERFKPAAKLMYAPVENHFLVRIGSDNLYDITGNVTKQYPNVIEWKHYPYPDVKARIVRDCILKKNGM